MTAVTDAKLVLETVAGKSLTAEQLQTIANRVRLADPARLTEFNPDGGYLWAADPENPTNEEIAQLFLDTTKHFWQSWLGHGAAKEIKNQAEIEAAAAELAAKAELD